MKKPGRQSVSIHRISCISYMEKLAALYDQLSPEGIFKLLNYGELLVQTGMYRNNIVYMNFSDRHAQ